MDSATALQAVIDGAFERAEEGRAQLKRGLGTPLGDL